MRTTGDNGTEAAFARGYLLNKFMWALSFVITEGSQAFVGFKICHLNTYIWTKYKENAKNRCHEPTQKEQYRMVENKLWNSPNLSDASQLGRTKVVKWKVWNAPLVASSPYWWLIHLVPGWKNLCDFPWTTEEGVKKSLHPTNFYNR